MSETGEKKRVKDFLIDYEKEFTVLGIFIAIVIFSSAIRIEIFGYILSFIFFLLAVIIFSSIMQGMYDYEDQSFSLTLFIIVLSFGFLVFTFYFLIDFRVLWRFALPYILYFSLLVFISWLLSLLAKLIPSNQDQSETDEAFFKKLFNLKGLTKKKKVIGILIIIACLVFVWGLLWGISFVSIRSAIPLARIINDLLDKAHEQIMNFDISKLK